MSTTAKKLVVLVFALVTLFCASANPVDKDRARQVGATYLSAMAHRPVETLKAVAVPFNEFYVFNAGDEGFVLVAADDCVRPILGYSLTGSFRVDNLPLQVRSWLEDYEHEIAYVKEAVAQDKKNAAYHGGRANAVEEEWRLLSVGIAPEPPLTTSVSPLLTTTWNQSPLYNDMCPYDSDYGQHVVTGCVATATAQIMKYWNHPATGYGSHSYTASNSHTNYGVQTADFGNTNYAWSIMPNALTSVSSQAEIDAVALLMYHVGVAVEMQYNVSSEGGSGAYNYRASGASSMSALIDYFKYSPDIVVMSRDGMDNAYFCAALRSELDQQRPILYSGSGNDGGHSFVCDGYDNNGLFHFNWGWGGSCDGYFAIGALNPSRYEFNVYNIALLGIRPNTAFGTGGTVMVNSTGGNSTCTVSGGGTYAFGDTVTLSAVAGEGYRFAGWSDNSQANPRSFTMTGGNYTFTARYETLGNDTMSYCGTLGHNSYWGEYQQGFDKYWGIKLPASSLTAGHTLTGVDFYVGSSYTGGYFDVTVYSGTSAPTDTVFTTQVWVGYEDRNDWYSVYLPAPYTVQAGKSLWLTFHNSDLLFPATISNSCGNPDGFLYGPSFQPDPKWNTFTFMIRGRFDNPGIIAQGDTISYCGTKAAVNSWGPAEWGIMIPAADLAGRNYLKSVKLFSYNGGLYTMRIYKGGANAPGILVHTQPANIETRGWNEVLLDQTVAINANDSLWITLSCPDGMWPAVMCRYTGNPNSNWITWGGIWEHANNSTWDSYSWMIKAVTSATAPLLPAPTVVISGEFYVAVGNTLNLTAAHSTGTTVTWTIQGGAPSTATGDAVSITWNQTGWYRVTASVTNSNGTGSDTMWVNVVDCSQTITEYPYVMGFEASDNGICFTMLDADNDGEGWEEYRYSAFAGQRSCMSGGWLWSNNSYQPRAMDNWLILPKMTTRQGVGISYNMQWYDMAEWMDNGAHAHYGVYIDTSAGTNTANYVLLAEYTTEEDWWNAKSLDLSAYAGKTFRLAFRHYNNGGLSSLFLDNITVNENIPFFREGDTISYCGWRPWLSQLGYTSGTTRWGVRFPSSRLASCDSVKSVMLYVIEDASYTLNVWQGGDNAPVTLLHSMDTVFSNQNGWREFVLDNPIAIDATQPLWITFLSNGAQPAAHAQFSGDYNSNWLSGDGVNWMHTTDYNYYGSWLIKAVMSATEGCGNINLPYAVDFTQCWHATGGATIIDSNHASFNSRGQKLVSPWFVAPQGRCFAFFSVIRDYGDNYWYNWEDSSVLFRVMLENESGMVQSIDWHSYQSEDSFSMDFIGNGGNYRFIFENIDDRTAHLMHLSNLVVFHYPLTVTLDGPTAVHVGDTVTIQALASRPNWDTIDAWYWDLYHDGYWIDTNDNSLSIIASTDSSRTIVFHATGEFDISVDAYINDLFGGYYAYAYDWKSILVRDSAAVDCDNISLPYTADFTQCWTAENGAVIVDYNYAQLGQQGRKIVGPWMNSTPGKTFLRWETMRDDPTDWVSSEYYTVSVLSESGNVLFRTEICASNGNWGDYFNAPGGRIRVVFEQIGNASMPSFRITGMSIFQYEINLEVEMPGLAHVGDTTVIAVHAILQNGDTPDYMEFSMYDGNDEWMDDDHPGRTILSRTDSSMMVVWNELGTYHLSAYAGKNSAFTNAYATINVVDYPFYEADSIYYSSAAKDTAIGCHQQLHRALLPEGVKAVRENAFRELPNLSVISLPNSMTYIGARAFAYNHRITEITIPRGMKYMGDAAFEYCRNLAVINFNADSCPVMSSTTGNWIYPVFCDCNSVTTINIGQNVKIIPDRAFAWITSLRGTIVIPDGVTYIGANAFYHWVDNWTEGDTIKVVLGRSLRKIGNNAFPGTGTSSSSSFNQKLTTVVARNPEPPVIYNATFYLNPDIAKLIVPCGSAEIYGRAYYWYEFTNVYENCTAIDDIETDEDMNIYGVNGGLVVDGALGETVAVYDMIGRQVASVINTGKRIATPQSGVYMVRVGDRPVRKVVVLQ